MEPTLSQVIEVVRNSSGEQRKPIDSNTLIEADLHICGMDGEDLLEDCEEAFGVQLATEEDGYMKTFSLAVNRQGEIKTRADLLRGQRGSISEWTGQTARASIKRRSFLRQFRLLCRKGLQ